ncbi:hypothetical protein GCK72_026160 [Caenorhabditis remanei]|uniref:Uncharacterized protein n=1 Tax=Caenorhabditis remanei TaxID=31234 RepID=A0A6A5G4R5_CAERE|nr:hypothetical protein GCK72_026160 [Caenorhabditis remanei]KAF1749692.1 hypothetical protein GCK72_026160 [Caenorhabditis remanei]
MSVLGHYQDELLFICTMIQLFHLEKIETSGKLTTLEILNQEPTQKLMRHHSSSCQYETCPTTTISDLTNTCGETRKQEK